METLTLEQLGDAIYRVRRNAGTSGENRTHTNYFYGRLEQDKFPAIASDSGLVFLDREQDLWRVYFVAADLAELGRQLGRLQQRPLVAEISERRSPSGDRPPGLEQLEQTCGAAGFRKLAQYARMTNSNLAARRSKAPPTRASEAHAAPLYDLIREHFDPRCDHLPSRTELTRQIAAGEVLVQLSDGQIDGYMTFRLDGQQGFAHLWYCRPGSHPVAALKLFAQFFTEMAARGITSSYLWVEAERTGPRNTFQTLGYQADGVAFHVYAKE